MGDKNTKYVPRSINHRKSINTVWEIPNREGRKVRIFQGLAYLGVAHIEHIYKDPNRENISEILKVVSYFPRLLEDKDNERMHDPISKNELFLILNSFNKENIPCPNGWTMKFLTSFFEL